MPWDQNAGEHYNIKIYKNSLKWWGINPNKSKPRLRRHYVQIEVSECLLKKRRRIFIFQFAIQTNKGQNIKNWLPACFVRL